MKIWIAKALVQKAISYLPASQRINTFFQKHVTKGLQLTDDLFEDKLGHFHYHWHFFNSCSTRSQHSFKALELGTGWYPIIPIMMFIKGAKKVYTWDVQSLVEPEYVQDTIGKFLTHANNGKISIPEDRLVTLKDCYQELNQKNVNDVLPMMNIERFIGDARQTGLDDHSIDLILSNNTFEHVDSSTLRQILTEFQRIASQGGVMSHFIDLTDHFSHLDKSISKLHFLKYSNRQWKWIDNSIQPQNRLRITDYRHIYYDLNIPIDVEQNEYLPEEELAKTTIDKSFQNISEQYLLVSHSYLVSKM